MPNQNIILQGNGNCSCMTNTYLNFTNLTCNTCDRMDINCITCSSTDYGNGSYGYFCIDCNYGYYPSGQICLPCNASLVGCLDCDNGTACTVCL